MKVINAVGYALCAMAFTGCFGNQSKKSVDEFDFEKVKAHLPESTIYTSSYRGVVLRHFMRSKSGSVYFCEIDSKVKTIQDVIIKPEKPNAMQQLGLGDLEGLSKQSPAFKEKFDSLKQSCLQASSAIPKDNPLNFPYLESSSDSDINKVYRDEYNARVLAHDQSPIKFKYNQIVQLIVENDRHKAFESIMIELGMIGTEACKAELPDIVKQYADRKVVGSRCLHTIVDLRETSEFEEYSVRVMDGNTGSGIRGGLGHLNDCLGELPVGDANQFGKPFNFDKHACVITKTDHPASPNDWEDYGEKSIKKPGVQQRLDPRSAVVQRDSVACHNQDHVGRSTFYGGHEFNTCYLVKGGTLVNVQDFGGAELVMIKVLRVERTNETDAVKEYNLFMPRMQLRSIE